MRLPHILIPVLILLPATILTTWLLKRAGIHIDTGLPMFACLLAGWFAGLPLYWWICKRFGIPPLFIFTPACPHCHKKPGGWWGIKPLKPHKHRLPAGAIFACGLCEKEVELWFERPAASDILASTLPVYRLRWPEFLGIWQRLPTAPAPAPDIPQES